MDDCSICFEELTASTGYCTLGCSHTFHLACIGRWMNHSSASCPLCRKEFGDTEVIPTPTTPMQDWLTSRTWTISRRRFNEPPIIRVELNDLRTIRIGEGIEVTEHDVEEVMEAADVSRSVAIQKLRVNEGNVIETIYDLTQNQPDSRPPIPTRNPLEPTDDMLTTWALERLFSKGTLLENHGYESLEHVHYRTTQAFRYGFWINPDYRNIPKKHRSDSL